MELTAENIFLKNITEDIIYPSDVIDNVERERRIALWKARAKDLGLLNSANNITKADLEIERKQIALARTSLKQMYNANKLELERDQYDRPKNTIQNFVEILTEHSEFKNKIVYNELAECPEVMTADTVEPWTDTHRAKAMNIIEQEFGIYNELKFDKAFSIVCGQIRYNPLKVKIDNLKWDGVHRIESFLSFALKCDNTPYTREVSRLIFAGGIHRLYNPGCKFDCVPILIGTKQGEGKSTAVRWLAMLDEGYCSVKTIDGKNGIEEINGKWICELDELIAVTRVKEVEAVKSFITRTKDRYREAYGKFPHDIPRKCIFIGTTNKAQCLTDPTGNRRFFPVVTHSSGYDLFERKDEIQAYIEQCWAEAKTLYDKGELPPYPNRELETVYLQMQENAAEEDIRRGMIEQYLNEKSIGESVCVPELWYKALKMGDNTFPTRKDSNDIVLIMSKFDEWERQAKTSRFEFYGVQKGWERIGRIVNEFGDLEF